MHLRFGAVPCSCHKLHSRSGFLFCDGHMAILLQTFVSICFDMHVLETSVSFSVELTALCICAFFLNIHFFSPFFVSGGQC